jgi:DNA helicase II / ATP-dependent DNA helicase PcrA
MATKKQFPPKKNNNSHIIKVESPKDWSPYQKDIFRDIAKGAGHTVVIARAGSAKTSSLVEGAKYIPKGKKSLFCAFNKHIQEELRGRLGSYIECLTLHSLGFRGIKQRFGNVELDNNKCWDLAEKIIGKEKDNYDLIENVTKAVDFCKATLTDIPSQIEEIIAEYGIELCDIPIATFIDLVVKVMRACKEKTNVIDFNDMIWFPFVYNINVGKYDYVFVDEAQDLNKAQIELAFSAVKSDGRIVAVLDPRQAIYSWRGADTKVLDNLQKRLSPKELKLPICYRCPKRVVTLAQSIVPDIQPFDKAKDGDILHIDISELKKYAKSGSYVLSRTNAPLIKHCMQFLKHNIPANILGRDIGSNLLYLIKKSKKKTVADLLKWIIKWEKQEKENLLAKFPKANTDFIADKAECLQMLCEDASSLDEVKRNIDNLFKDNEEKDIVLFSSVHKIKGKETNKVFILMDTLRGGSEEEENIEYVAYTRAKETLYLVRKPSKYEPYDDFKKESLHPKN